MSARRRRTSPVFPAHAGVFLCSRYAPSHSACLPRACGGVSVTKAPKAAKPVSSPRMRGCFPSSRSPWVWMRVFPAHAGVFLRRRHFKLSRIGLPRACGGVSETTARGSMMTTSSPRMRGCFRGTQGRSRGPLGLPRACGGVSPSTRISTTNISVFPAHAGVFPQSFAHASVRSSLPRACGGVSFPPAFTLMSSGGSISGSKT